MPTTASSFITRRNGQRHPGHYIGPDVTGPIGSRQQALRDSHPVAGKHHRRRRQRRRQPDSGNVQTASFWMGRTRRIILCKAIGLARRQTDQWAGERAGGGRHFRGAGQHHWRDGSECGQRALGQRGCGHLPVHQRRDGKRHPGQYHRHRCDRRLGPGNTLEGVYVESAPPTRLAEQWRVRATSFRRTKLAACG